MNLKVMRHTTRLSVDLVTTVLEYVVISLQYNSCWIGRKSAQSLPIYRSQDSRLSFPVSSFYGFSGASL